MKSTKKKYQLVLQWPFADPSDLDHLFYYERTLDWRLSRRLAVVDGHDFGSGEMNIFIYTDNPTKAFEECRALIRSARIAERLAAAYRDREGDEYVRLWPAGSQDAFAVK